LGVFAGAAVVALVLVALGPRLADEGGALPAWGFLALVVCVDVAHVWSTLFRTYFDGDELAKRPGLYTAVPIACFAAGAALHSVSSTWFWRALAYVALFHFVRQQVGWVAIYRARAGLAGSRLDRLLDQAAVYAATLYPVAFWHANMPRDFHWFLPGDFASIAALHAALPALFAAWALALVAYVARAVQLAIQRGLVQVGKHTVVAATFATWYVGIVATNSDYTFSVANVIVHGVPYFALLWFYAKARAGERPATLASRVVLRGGFAAFMTILLLLAFAEEMIWDRVVWRARPEIFGGGGDAPVEPPPALLAFLVPLLALPQATHYVLDAVLWRRRDTGAAQAKAMGFAAAPP
jgi:hypothetical protein